MGRRPAGPGSETRGGTGKEERADSRRLRTHQYSRDPIVPFENHGSRSFTMIAIGKNAPAASGVYGLSDARRWIYVGETANIQAELYRLLQFSSPLLRDHAPSGFTFELSSAENRLERQNRLVFELPRRSRER